MKGIPFIVSAPSGAGKTTLCNMAVDFFPDLRHSISYTTRAPRAGERNGVEYWFVDEAEFGRMVRAGEFLEHAGVHGKHYGTSRVDLEKNLLAGLDVMLDIDVQGAEKTRGVLEGGVYVFILPPSVAECERRLEGRGKDSPEEIQKRLKVALDEIKRVGLYDYVIINDEVQAAFDRLKSVIMAERARKDRMMQSVIELFNL